MLSRIFAAFLMAALADAAFAQGNSSSSSSGSAQQGGDDEIQVGAGSNSDVTTGSSGSKKSPSSKIDPAPAGFDLHPARDPFLGPAQLDIRRPARLRCDLIGEPGARARCEAKANG